MRRRIDDHWPLVCMAVVIGGFGIIGAFVGAVVQVWRRSPA